MIPHWTIEAAGWLVTVIAVGGVLLNNRRRRQCFYLWLVSNALSALIHLAVGLWSLAFRDLIFLALAIEGLRKWRRP